MYINEGVNQRYCYASEIVWNKEKKKYHTSGKCIGQLNSEGILIPNKYLSQLFLSETTDNADLSEHEQLVIKTVVEKYGEGIRNRIKVLPPKMYSEDVFMTANPVFIGPELVFGAISKRYRIDTLLRKSFGEMTANDILSLTCYIAAEGSALSNSDSWLEYYENPHGSSMSSQDISRLLDAIEYDGIMTFYKMWLKEIRNRSDKPDKMLYDLTSVSYYGKGIDSVEYGYNRDHEHLPQVNYGLLCLRTTGMPLFAWTMNGSISDISTLETMLQFLKKLEFTPDCLMMDRGFCSKENLTGMFKNGYTFLQAVKTNAEWVYDVIDSSEKERHNPDSKLDVEGRTYYVSTSICQWVRIKNASAEETVHVHICSSSHREKYICTIKNTEVIAQYPCRVHVLFCQDLIGNQYDKFMDKLKTEHDRLVADDTAEVKKEFRKYIKVKRPKYARHRSVEYDTEMIAQYKNRYAGYVCFLTNDKTVQTAENALAEYSTRDYIEKDFDEMKNELDMGRIRVHTDKRMQSRLFIQFIAEIYMREIHFCISKSEKCKKFTKKQIFSHIKTIQKVTFKGKYKDVYPQLSRSQRDILEALDVCFAM